MSRTVAMVLRLNALLVTHGACEDDGRMRRCLGRLGRVLVIAVPSFAAGAVLTAYFVATASLVSFQTLRAGYASQEQVAAECAQRSGDAPEAARHYANVVSAYADGGWWRKSPHIKT